MSDRLEQIFRDLIAEQDQRADQLPPVDKWNPPLSGDMDLRITRSGEWIHEGDPIRRPQLVNLFASILKREGDDYFLVTPVEKWRITVEDVPFQVIAVERLERNGEQALQFTTSTGDKVMAGPDHPLRVDIDPGTGEPSPYLLIRKNMEGLLARPVFYQITDYATNGRDTKKAVHGVYSLGHFFPLE